MSSYGDESVKNAWAFYDWANSVYPLVISTAIFPMFYNAVTSNKETGYDHVDFFGWDFVNTEIYSYVLAASFLVVIIISPVLSGLADATGSKKKFLSGFCLLGGLSCAALYFFDVEYLEWAMLAFLLSSVGYWGSIVFYNAYLPEIAPPEEHDRLSAKGFSMGYIGSVMLLLINLGMILGIGDHLTRWCFVLVAVWWIGFAQYTLRKLPSNPYKLKTDKPFAQGFIELASVFKQVMQLKRLKRYLLAFFTISMAVQTIMLIAQFFGLKEVKQIIDGVEVIGLTTAQFITAVLIIQIIAIPGAYLFSYLSSKLGNIKVLMIAVLLWIGVCFYAYAVIETPMEFYIAAGWIGFIMGGTQSLARSTYSKLLPETKDHASFFSFFDVLEKVGLVIGMFTFGFLEGMSDNMRTPILSLMVFFVIGMVLLMIVPKHESISF